MDRQDAKPSRPSLLAGGNTSPAPPASGRILADMESRAPRPPRAERAPHRRREWWPALGALAVAAVALAWWIGSGPDVAPATTDAEVAYTDADQEPLAIDDGGDAATPDVATIVAGTDPGEFADPAAATDGAQSTAVATAAPLATPPATPPPVATASAPAAAPTPADGNPFAGTTSATRTTGASAARPLRTAGAGSTAPPSRTDSGGTDLLATLLGNIKHSEQAGRSGERPALQRPQSGSDQEALELLVRQVRERDAAAARKPSPGASAGPPVATALLSSEQVQAQLRRCPRANTTAGLSCRQKVCAKVAGRDAACPKPQ